MGFGRVVVTTTIGTEGIDTQHNKDIIIADSPENFSNELEKAITDHPYCRQIGKNAFTFVADKLDNDKMVAEFLEFLNKKI